jgi:hypothetical protein
MPLAQAVAFVFVMTNHVTWTVFTDELRMSRSKAVATTVTGLESGLFNTSSG